MRDARVVRARLREVYEAIATSRRAAREAQLREQCARPLKHFYRPRGAQKNCFRMIYDVFSRSDRVFTGLWGFIASLPSS